MERGACLPRREEKAAGLRGLRPALQGRREKQLAFEAAL
jgi:hypothetical protein